MGDGKILGGRARSWGDGPDLGGTGTILGGRARSFQQLISLQYLCGNHPKTSLPPPSNPPMGGDLGVGGAMTSCAPARVEARNRKQRCGS